MHRISGRIIRLFFYMASRIWQAGYPVIKKAGYPAKYTAKKIHLNTAYNIIQSFDFLWPQSTLCDLLWSHVTSFYLMWPQPTYLMWPNVTSCDLSQPHVTSPFLQTLADLIWPHVTLCNIMWQDVTSCTLMLRQPTSCDLDILVGPQQLFCDLIHHLVILANFIWPQLIPFVLSDLIILLVTSTSMLWPQPSSCDLSWLIWLPVTSAILMGPQQPFCDLSRPLMALADLIWTRLN